MAQYLERYAKHDGAFDAPYFEAAKGECPKAECAGEQAECAGEQAECAGQKCANAECGDAQCDPQACTCPAGTCGQEGVCQQNNCTGCPGKVVAVEPVTETVTE